VNDGDSDSVFIRNKARRKGIKRMGKKHSGGKMRRRGFERRRERENKHRKSGGRRLRDGVRYSLVL